MLDGGQAFKGIYIGRALSTPLHSISPFPPSSFPSSPSHRFPTLVQTVPNKQVIWPEKTTTAKTTALPLSWGAKVREHPQLSALPSNTGLTTWLATKQNFLGSLSKWMARKHTAIYRQRAVCASSARCSAHFETNFMAMNTSYPTTFSTQWTPLYYLSK